MVIVVISALLASAATLLFAELDIQNVLIATLVAIVLWIPANTFTVVALRRGYPAQRVVQVFGVATSIADALLGVFVQGNKPNTWELFFIGILLGVGLILTSQENKQNTDLKSNNEYICYLLGAVLIAAALYTNTWLLSITAYALADFIGLVLSSRILQLMKGKDSLLKDMIASTLGFAPLMLTVEGLILYSTNIALLGPATTVASLAFASIGAALVFKTKLIWKTELIRFSMAAASIVAIFASF
jgi:hypothetical protein